jgi:hypothetical protein
VLALAAAEGAVANVLPTSAAAAAVLAFMGKALTGPPVALAAAAAAVGLVALAVAAYVIIVPHAVVLVPLATMAARVVHTEAAPVMDQPTITVAIVALSASYGPVLHGHSRQHQ